jgi:hypothetical protein
LQRIPRRVSYGGRTAPAPPTCAEEARDRISRETYRRPPRASVRTSR